MRLIAIAAGTLGVMFLAGIAPASAIDVTSLANDGSPDVWQDGTSNNQTRNGGTTTISNEQSLDGDGALRLHSPDSSARPRRSSPARRRSATSARCRRSATSITGIPRAPIRTPRRRRCGSTSRTGRGGMAS